MNKQVTEKKMLERILRNQRVIMLALANIASAIQINPRIKEAIGRWEEDMRQSTKELLGD